jgi:hypothetical protein
MAPRIWPGISSPLWQDCARTEIANAVIAYAATIFRTCCFIRNDSGCGAALVCLDAARELPVSRARSPGMQAEKEGRRVILHYNLLLKPDKLSKNTIAAAFLA